MAYAKARALLEALARGETPDELAEELAAAVLDDEVVQLALMVREDRAHRWRRAIELAGLLLVAERAEMGAGAGDATSGPSGGS